jgi:hypothetical protein
MIKYTQIIPVGETILIGGESCLGYETIVFSCKTDTACKVFVDYSIDNVNWDSTLTFDVTANFNEVHRLVNTKQWYRVRVQNNSGVAQTFFRFQSLLGNHSPLTSILNSTIQEDADTLPTRPLDFNLMVAEGLYQNRVITIKDGLNSQVSSGSVPEDVWDEGGIYTGFPVGTPEEGQIFVAGADVGNVYYFYMASSEDIDYSFGSVAINGSGNYNLGHDVFRCNFMYFVGTNPIGFNVSKISMRNVTTTSNVFCVIQVGFSQSYCAAYTVPKGSSIYIDRYTGNVRGSTSGTVEGFMWYRPLGESPRVRFPFEMNFGTLYFDDIDYTIKISQQVDIVPRITFASSNNLAVKLSYRLLKVR